MAGLMVRFRIAKSALARMPGPTVALRLTPILEAGEAATCALVDLEFLYRTRNAKEHERTRRRRALAYDRVPPDEKVLDRAIELQGLLARSGRHRIPITVLHYDGDLDVIASVTGQPVEWVVPCGSVP